MIVIQNQSLLDIAIQEEGSALAAFEWAFANGLSVTDELRPGQELKSPNAYFKNKEVANYFKGKGFMIATAEIDDNDYSLPNMFPISL